MSDYGEPWSVDDGCLRRANHSYVEIGSPWIDDIYPTDRKFAEKADREMARIIACVNGCKGLNPEAVPDLLVACEAVIKHAPVQWRDSNKDARAAFDSLEDAFAKAKQPPPRDMDAGHIQHPACPNVTGPSTAGRGN